MRAALPPGLADPNSKLRTAVGLAVAAIAKWDCPDAWPDLLDNLLRAIDQRDNQPLGGFSIVRHVMAWHATRECATPCQPAGSSAIAGCGVANVWTWGNCC